MKNNYLLALLVALIFVSCSKTEDVLVPVGAQNTQNESGVLNKKSNSKKSKEIEGKLTYKRGEFDVDCGDHWNEGYFNDGSYLGQGELEGFGKVSSKTKAWATFISGNQGPVGVHIGYQCCSFFDSNGDELILTTKGYDLYFNSYGIAVGKCKFDFAGGTGKFENAKGNFKGYVENPLQGEFTVDLEGKLSY